MWVFSLTVTIPNPTLEAWMLAGNAVAERQSK